ncbi:TPA: hypothetical protein ACH3X3_010403 [Trebouxia sp. C0006]
MLGRHWQRTSCSASGNPVPNTHFPQEDRGGSESDDSADEYETDNKDKVQPSKSTSPPVRKVMQAMAMPKRAKATKQATLVDIGVAQAPVSTALRRAESRRAAEATSKSSAASGAPAYKGIGEYNRRLKEAGIRAGDIVHYEDTEKGKEALRKDAAYREGNDKLDEAAAALDYGFLSGKRASSPLLIEAEEEDEMGGKGSKSEMRDLEDRLMHRFTPDFPWNAFEAAATKLKDRLEPAVIMEDDEAKAAIQQLYSKAKISELAKSGLILVDLRATVTGELYGDTVWRFSQLPRPARQPPAAAVQLPLQPGTKGNQGSVAAFRQGRQVVPGSGPMAAQGGNMRQQQQSNSNSKAGVHPASTAGSNAAVPSAELPYHRFKAGESILISNSKGQEGMTSFTGTMLEVKKTHVLVVLDLQRNADLQKFMKEQGKAPSFRLDKQALEATTTRQLQALDKVNQFRSIRQAIMTGNGARSLPDLKAQFMGELHVKLILTGLGSNLADRAKSPPIWATGGSRPDAGQAWRNEAGAYIRSFQTLNRSQQEAVAKAVLRTFTLWQGPPGTGKTRTLLAFIEVMVNSRPVNPFTPILACADTNAAVDNIVEGLMARRINVVRLGQPAKVRADLRSVCLEALTERTPDGQKAVQLRKEADRLMEKYNKGGELFEKLTPAQVTSFKHGATDKRKKARALIRDASTEVLRNCQVVAATCAGAGDEARLHNQIFRIVVIDEATQATEPSTLIPLVRGAESVVMAGDPKQLPPTVISRGAEKAGLQVTVFDRLQRSGIKPLLLDTQYRMHPLIAHLPSKLFYDGRLQSGVTAHDRPLPAGFPWPNPKCPVALVPCDFGKEQTGQASRTTLLAEGAAAVAGDVAETGASFKNEIEAAIAIRVLETLLSGGDVQSAALLTPYNGQVRELQRRFSGSRQLAAFEGMVDISSVDGYQGREADVIVMSTVRCNRHGKLGFVTDPRRLNVAISRPRRGLVIVGSPETLKANSNWLEWLEWVRSQNAILHSDDLA